jgi:hypothetical protein
VTTTILKGQFGVVREVSDVEFAFPYFGQTIRVAPNASDLPFYEMMRAAKNIDLGDIDMDNPASWDSAQRAKMHAASDAAVGLVEEQIHPDDFPLFMKTAKANGQKLLDLIATSEQIAQAVAEEQSGGFPTQLSAVSSTGPQTTKRKSGGRSSLRAPRRRKAPVGLPSAADSAKALASLEGRPDLQEFVVMGMEAAEAS